MHQVLQQVASLQPTDDANWRWNRRTKRQWRISSKPSLPQLRLACLKGASAKETAALAAASALRQHWGEIAGGAVQSAVKPGANPHHCLALI